MFVTVEKDNLIYGVFVAELMTRSCVSSYIRTVCVADVYSLNLLTLMYELELDFILLEVVKILVCSFYGDGISANSAMVCWMALMVSCVDDRGGD